MRKLLFACACALLLVGCGKHPAQEGIEEAFCKNQPATCHG
jgi:uncharacterized protein YcfL